MNLNRRISITFSPGDVEKTGHLFIRRDDILVQHFCDRLKSAFHHILVETGEFLREPFTDLGQGNECPLSLSAIDYSFKFQFTQRLPDDGPAHPIKLTKVLLARDLMA